MGLVLGAYKNWDLYLYSNQKRVTDEKSGELSKATIACVHTAIWVNIHQRPPNGGGHHQAAVRALIGRLWPMQSALACCCARRAVAVVGHVAIEAAVAE